MFVHISTHFSVNTKSFTQNQCPAVLDALGLASWTAAMDAISIEGRPIGREIIMEV
jgi:hypothetical protein